MTEKQEKSSSSSPEPENTLRFQLPEVNDVDVFLLRDEDGNVIARTGAELGAEKPESSPGGAQP